MESIELLSGTFNLWEDESHDLLRTALAGEAISQLVREVRPDHYLFGFQEVRAGQHGHPLYQIAHQLGLEPSHVGFCSASRNSQRGVGIVTSGEIGAFKDIRLPDDEADNLFFGFRFPGAWEVNFSGTTVLAVASHGTVVPHMQEAQATALVSFAIETANGKPIVIMTDTNAGADTNAYKVYTTAFTDQTVVLRNNYKISWPWALHWIKRMSHEMGNKPPAFLDDTTIHRWMDYIFTSYEFHPVYARVLNENPFCGMYFSDHLAPVVRLTLKI